MADKLAESTWTTYRKKAKLEVDDKALVKALTEFDKTGEDDPAAQAEALVAVIDQINKQVVALGRIKKQIGDKPFTEAKDKLHGLLDAAETLQKTVNARVAAQKADAADAAKAAKDAKGGKNDDDAEDASPALLTTKMLPLLRELRKGEVRMNAMVCTAGKNTAVLIMRRPISATMRKVLAEAVDAQGGMKYAVGECAWENKALTFTLQTPAAGLARKLTAALLAQTQLRLKVRVRGPDGDDEDGENEDDEASSATQEAPSAASYEQRLTGLRDRYAQAVQDQHPEVTRLRALMGIASEKAALQDYAAAMLALAGVEKLLGSAEVPADIQNALKQWQASRSAVIAQLQRLEAEIAAFEDPLSAEATIRVKAVQANITAQPTSLQTVDELETYLQSDRIVRAVEAPNGFGFSVAVRDPLLAALRTLRPVLAARQR